MSDSLMIDPNSDEAKSGGGGGKFGEFVKSVGPKIFAPVAFERDVASTGTKILKVRCVCVEDLSDGGSDVGRDIDCKFFLTPSAIKQFARFAHCLGSTKPINVLSDDDVTDLISRGYFKGSVKQEDPWTDSKGEVKPGRMAVRFYDPCPTEPDPLWDDIVGDASERWNALVEWRIANPKTKFGKGKGGSAPSSGGSQPGDDEDGF